MTYQICRRMMRRRGKQQLKAPVCDVERDINLCDGLFSTQNRVARWSLVGGQGSRKLWPALNYYH
jgi:hypothetical protein